VKKFIPQSEIEWIQLLRWLLWLSAMPALLIGLFVGHALPPHWFWIVLFAYSFLNLILLLYRGKLRQKQSLEMKSDQPTNVDRGDGGAQ
jgi:Na+-driven multidrug efflux pump